MYVRRTISLLVVSAFSCVWACFAQDIIPRPEKMELGEGNFIMNAGTRISIASSPLKLGESAQLLADYIKESRGLDLKIVKTAAGTNNLIVLNLTSTKSGDESYRLDIAPGTVTITAPAVCGIGYGIQSLRQLVDASLSLPCLKITDAPRYSWRGLMLDESRHFFGAEQVRKLLDRMAYYKLNRFHWHLTDSDGWRIEIKKYPKLTSVGGKGNRSNKNAPARFYTQDEIKRIVEYARVRNITVIPEIDMPGHANAAIRAYPEFSGGDSKRVSTFTFNPGKEETYSFLSDILAETAELFPGPWLHSGGDEVHYGNEKWSSLPEVKELMKREGYKDLHQVEYYFNRRMAAVIESLGKTGIGWEEVFDSGVTPKQTVVMWWKHRKEDVHNRKHRINRALNNGHKVIVCRRIPLYFDFRQHSSERCNPRSPVNGLSSVYACPDSLGIGKLTESQQSLIMGVQACIWTEKIKEVKRLEYMTFPRIAALAEAAWTSKSNKNYDGFLKRLKTHLKQYRKWGIYYFDPFNPTDVKEPIGP